MTEEETETLRRALRPKRGFEDFGMYFVWTWAVVATVYFGAHVVSWMVAG